MALLYPSLFKAVLILSTIVDALFFAGITHFSKYIGRFGRCEVGEYLESAVYEGRIHDLPQLFIQLKIGAAINVKFHSGFVEEKLGLVDANF